MAKKEHTEKKENVLKEAIERTRDHGFYLKEGKEVTVFFLDGTSITGIFNYIGRYEIFLIIKNKDGVEEEATIFKNAIKYII